MRSCSLAVTALFAILACIGCGEQTDLGPTGTISGTLTYNGKPLATGTQVIFMEPERGFAGVGLTDAEGNFAITHHRKSTGATPEMPIGTYVVMVQPSAGGDGTADEAGGEGGVMTPEEVAAANRERRSAKTEIPAKYRQPSTTDISHEVKEGENSFEIDLK